MIKVEDPWNGGPIYINPDLVLTIRRNVQSWTRMYADGTQEPESRTDTVIQMYGQKDTITLHDRDPDEIRALIEAAQRE